MNLYPHNNLQRAHIYRGLQLRYRQCIAQHPRTYYGIEISNLKYKLTQIGVQHMLLTSIPLHRTRNMSVYASVLSFWRSSTKYCYILHYEFDRDQGLRVKRYYIDAGDRRLTEPARRRFHINLTCRFHISTSLLEFVNLAISDTQ